MAKRFLIAALAFALVFMCMAGGESQTAAEEEKGYTISEPWQYPIAPGSAEWDALNLWERIELLAVDRETAEQMTTEALMQTVLNYPFIVNIWAYENTDHGIEVVEGYFPALSVFTEREDMPAALDAYAEKCAEEGDENDVDYLVETNLHVAHHFQRYFSVKK